MSAPIASELICLLSFLLGLLIEHCCIDRSHGKFNSFARQVSGWGFNRITAGADFNSYYHELFLRGKPHLCLLMKRLTAKESAKRKESKRSGQAVRFFPCTFGPLEWLLF